MKGMQKKDSGVSEAIGYIIIFGLVMTGIGLITLYGYPVLMQQESSANIRNMEQTMIVLQNDLKSLTYKLVPYKETTLRVSGGTLTLLDSNSPLITQWFRVSGPGFAPADLLPGELRFTSEKDNTVIALENGAVIERQAGSAGSFMLAEPRWYVDVDPISGSRSLIVNYVRFVPVAATKVLSETAVGTVRTRHSGTMFYGPATYDPPGQTITITYSPNPDSDYSLAWRNFFTDANGLAMTETAPGSNTYTMSGVNTVLVKEYDVIVEEL
jgi:hypothetical protein